MTNREAIKIVKSSMLLHSYRYSKEELEEAFNIVTNSSFWRDSIKEEFRQASSAKGSMMFHLSEIENIIDSAVIEGEENE